MKIRSIDCVHEKLKEMNKEWNDFPCEEFPFRIFIEGFFYDFDDLTNWFWKQSGPPNGLCQEKHSTNPICPIELQHGKEQNNSRFWLEFEDHEHQGNWIELGVVKTGVDHYIAEWRFKTEEQLKLVEDYVKNL